MLSYQFSDLVLAVFKLEMRNSKYQMGLPMLIVYDVLQCQNQFENMHTALHVSFPVHILRLSTIALLPCIIDCTIHKVNDPQF